MRIRNAADREKAEAIRLAQWRASLAWTPIKERLPVTDGHILVKLSDGRFVGGYWDGYKWTHSPFDRWGVPVEWVELEPRHSSPH